MFEIKLIIFLVTISSFILMLAGNRDFLSPVKMVFYFTFFFYLGVYLSDTSILTMSAYVSLILMLAAISLLDKPVKNVLHASSNGGPSRISVPTSKYFLLLILVLPVLLLKVKLILDAGGLFNYLMSLAFRVKLLEGKGWIVILFSSVQVLFVYFIFLFLLDSNKKLIKYFLLVAFVTIFLFVGLTSGSRSALVVPFLAIFVIYNYAISQWSFSSLSIAAIILLSFVGLYGSFRNRFGQSSIDDLEISGFDLSHFYYGTNPLEIVANSSDHPLLLGETYLTLFTNFIPRVIYPSKPDTGGLVFTKFYTNDQWGGLSNLAPGAFGEAIMNFGLFPGFIFGWMLTLVIIFLAVVMFRRSLSYLYNGGGSLYRKGYMFILSLYFVFVAARFSYSEFTNVMFSFVLMGLIPLTIAYFVLILRWKIRA